jgi:hypothetical protein
MRNLFLRDDLPAEFKEFLSKNSDLNFLEVKFENDLESPTNLRNNNQYLSEIETSKEKSIIALRSLLFLPFYHTELCVNMIDRIYDLTEVFFSCLL